MKAFLLCLILINGGCLRTGKSKIFYIVADGNGGDRNGAILICDYLKKRKVNSRLINSEEIDKINGDSTYLFIGQSAVNNLIGNNRPLNNAKIFVYSHIVSDKMIIFSKKNNIIIVTTVSESQRLNSAKFIAIPLAIPGYIKNEAKNTYNDNKDIVDKITSNPVIHLGGSYKDANGKNIAINDNHFGLVKKRLSIDNTSKVSVVIHPRTFQDILSNKEDIRKRLLSISGKNGVFNTYFFADRKLYDIVAQNQDYFKEFTIYQSPPYSAILYAINELNVKPSQYVSVDQYNAFSDINHKVVGFLLNDSDKNQLAYLDQYNKITGSQNINYGKIIKSDLIDNK